MAEEQEQTTAPAAEATEEMSILDEIVNATKLKPAASNNASLEPTSPAAIGRFLVRSTCGSILRSA